MISDIETQNSGYKQQIEKSAVIALFAGYDPHSDSDLKFTKQNAQ